MRQNLIKQIGITIWLSGLSGSGKTSIASKLEEYLFAASFLTCCLDGDNLRLGLNRDLGFSQVDRSENIRRIAEVCKILNDSGVVVLVAAISPFEKDRQVAKNLIGTESFFEVYINTPLEICELRDPKGLYKKARKGELKNFTGIDSPYEVPKNPFQEINGELNIAKNALTLFYKIKEKIEINK